MNSEQRQIELYEAESSQRQHHENQKQYEEMLAAFDKAVFTLFSLLKPKIYMDGNQWCVLYGENLQDGICGFGDTPKKAVMDFNGAWDKTTVK
jgi:hypothetical protein